MNQIAFNGEVELSIAKMAGIVGGEGESTRMQKTFTRVTKIGLCQSRNHLPNESCSCSQPLPLCCNECILISFADYLLSVHTTQDRIAKSEDLGEDFKGKGGEQWEGFDYLFYFSLLTCSSVYIEIMLAFPGSSQEARTLAFFPHIGAVAE